MGTTCTDPDHERLRPANVRYWCGRLPTSPGMLGLVDNRRRTAIEASRARPDARIRRLQLKLRRQSERLRQLRPVLSPATHRQPELPDVPVLEIARFCADAAGISLRDILSARRNRSIVRPRQACMYLAKKLTKRSLPEIGKRLGGRDHSTVLHAIRTIEKLLAADDRRVKTIVGYVMAQLPQGYAL